MTLFLPLLLTHFLADYPLQWGGLIRLKKKGYLGVLLHCLVHLGVMAGLLFPLLHLKEVWLGIGVIFVTHNAIDYVKVNLDKRHPEWRLKLYLTDQLLHILMVAMTAFYLKNSLPQSAFPALYANSSLFLYGLILVWGTYFWDITHYFLRHPHKDALYVRNWKMIVRNALIVTAVFGGYWVFG